MRNRAVVTYARSPPGHLTHRTDQASGLDWLPPPQTLAFCSEWVRSKSYRPLPRNTMQQGEDAWA